MDASRTARSVATVAVAAVVLVGFLGSAPLAAAQADATRDGDRAPGAVDVAGNVTNETGDALTNATDTVTDGVENTTDAVTNTTDAVTNTTEETTETAENLTDATDEVTNGTDEVTNETEDAGDTTEDVADVTEDVTNATETVTDGTDDLTDGTEETVENTTATVSDTTENVTSAVSNTTENATSAVSTITETVTAPLLEGTTVRIAGSADPAAGPSINATVTVGGAGTVASVSASTVSTPRGATPVDAGEPTAKTDDAGGLAAETGDAESAREVSPASTPSGEAESAPGDRGSSGDRSPVPSPDGATLGGAVAVAGLTAAVTSKQLAAQAPAAGGQGLVELGRLAHARFDAAVEPVRAQLSRLPRVLGFPGYSRHDDSDPLEHDVRRSLFEAVERSPGVHLSGLADGADASLSTVRHHLRILEEEHLLVSERIRGRRRYFLANEAEPALVAALDDSATESILRTLARSGPATVSELADALDRDPSTISHHVSRLEDDGLVERERDGRSVRNELAPVAERVLSQGAESRQRPVATD